MNRLRKRVYEQMDPLAWSEAGVSPTNQAILWIVILSIVVAVLQSEPILGRAVPRVFWVSNA